MEELVIALDPSGNFTEGKGTTGWCASDDGYIFKAGQISAAEYATQMEYWTAVTTLIRDLAKKEQYKHIRIVCEDYRLYASASEAQINSNLETPQLIGVIKWFCFLNGFPITLQMASEVKSRWSDEVLERKGIISYDKKLRRYKMGHIVLQHHSMDAVRHCLHYNTFKTSHKEVKRKKLSSYSSEKRVYRYYDD